MASQEVTTLMDRARCGWSAPACLRIGSVAILLTLFWSPLALGGEPTPARSQRVQRLRLQARAWQEPALELARTKGWRIRSAGGPQRYELVAFRNGRPVYRINGNAGAAVGAAVHPVWGAPFELSGAGERIGIWDWGMIRASHQEFGSRVSVREVGEADDHFTHTAGTIGAAGQDPRARGMAAGIQIDSYDWFEDLAEMTAAAAAGPSEAGRLHLSNHSYGIVAGWETGAFGGTEGFYWFGLQTERQDAIFGQYNAEAADWDQLCVDAPYYLPIKMAGNHRDDVPPEVGGVFYYFDEDLVDWQAKTYDPLTDPVADGWNQSGFNTITDAGCAKNVLTVGAVGGAVVDGVRRPDLAATSSFSSWGPVGAGRVKPDLVAPGENLYSSLALSDGAYGIQSGTSMASAVVSGASALVVQAFRRHFGGAPRAATLKALLIHTTDDLGAVGPDYVYGWGLIHAQAAVELVARHAETPRLSHLIEGTRQDPETTVTSWTVLADGGVPLRITLCWTDPAAPAQNTPGAPVPTLIHDLDLRVVSLSDAQTTRPYVLDPLNPTASATTGDNTLDNVEQVVIPNPPTRGAYRIEVSHKSPLSNGPQPFSLIITGQVLPPAPAGYWIVY